MTAADLMESLLAFDVSTSAHRSGVPEGTARHKLREATSGDHAAVDAAYASFDLSMPDQYRAFLEAQFACVWPLEQALTAAGAERLFTNWPDQRRAGSIAADLADLGAADMSIPQLDFAPAVSSDAAVLGSLYVLEGSRFGGAVLARNLPTHMPRRFLASGSDPHVWRSLLALMDRDLAPERALDVAIVAARAIFSAFEAAARALLEMTVD